MEKRPDVGLLYWYEAKTHWDERERLWTTRLMAEIAYRGIENMELIPLIDTRC
jgi:hypothetical protein